MIGAVLVVLILVVGLPVFFTVSGTVIAMIIGDFLWRDGEKRCNGDERVELNR